MSFTGMRHLFDDRETETVTNLAIGAPGPSTLKRITEIFRQSSEDLSRISASEDDVARGNGVIFQYGPSWGYEPFLRSLATFLTEEYGCSDRPVNAKTLFLTGGATTGLWLASTILLPSVKERGVVFIECPSYFIAQSVLHDAVGHRIVPVPMSDDGTGVDVDLLESAVEKETRLHRPTTTIEEGKFWAMFYTIPTFHNPTGSLLTPEKSRRVVEIARKYDLLVFCDDVYNCLHFDPKSAVNPPKRLFAYDDPDDADYRGNVISNGSFSKILGPGYRVGWMEVAPRMFDPLCNSGIIQSGGSMNNVMAGILGSTLDLGLQRKHLVHLRQEYAVRSTAMFDILEQKLPAGFYTLRPRGGYFGWVRGPQDFDSTKFCEWCVKEFKVQILASVRCGETELKPCRNSFRFSWAFYEKERLRDSMEQLCSALRQYLADKKKV